MENFIKWGRICIIGFLVYSIAMAYISPSAASKDLVFKDWYVTVEEIFFQFGYALRQITLYVFSW